MGDIADMMLDGTLCQYCGVFIGSDNDCPTSCGCDETEDDLPNWCCECDWFPPAADKSYCGQKSKYVKRLTLACEKFR